MYTDGLQSDEGKFKIEKTYDGLCMCMFVVMYEKELIFFFIIT